MFAKLYREVPCTEMEQAGEKKPIMEELGDSLELET